MSKQHHYKATIKWTGNKGTGTDNYRNYERSHQIIIENKSDILGSSDPAFRGDKTKHNPEDLLVSSLSSCHMLWYLHLCSEAGVFVTDYEDNATGIMLETSNGGGQFSEVTLYPIVTVTEENMIGKANELHKKANELCFIANSVNFPVRHNPTAKYIDKEKNRKKQRTASIGLAIWRLKCPYEIFVQGSTTIILLNFCAKIPPQRKAAKPL